MDIPPGAEIISLIGVNYVRLNTADGGDLYLTKFGLPFLRQLAPENWREPRWFAEKRVRLEWIEGLNAVQATRAFGMTGAAADKFLAETTLRATDDLEQRGFRVLDMKPEHVVVRVFDDGSLLRRRNGNLAYALVDYELLERFGVWSPRIQASPPIEACAR